MADTTNPNSQPSSNLERLFYLILLTCLLCALFLFALNAAFSSYFCGHSVRKVSGRYRLSRVSEVAPHLDQRVGEVWYKTVRTLVVATPLGVVALVLLLGSGAWGQPRSHGPDLDTFEILIRIARWLFVVPGILIAAALLIRFARVLRVFG